MCIRDRGYAVQQSEEFLAKQRALVQEKALKANIVIATAQVRGNKAPLLITEETINAMKPGSVITVSYTHLDVYKRQSMISGKFSNSI